MSTATDQLTNVEEKILETLATIQKPIVDAVGRLAERAENYVPELPRSESLPAFDELILTQFGFAEKLLANQRDFVNKLLDAIKPVSTKVATEPTSKPKSTTAKAA
jgi:hypothetical protein